MSDGTATRRGLVTLLVAGGALASAAIALRVPGGVRVAEAGLPGFTAEESPAGLVVTSVRDGGVAERAGIAPGDLIISVDQHPFRRLRDATRYLKNDRRDQVRFGLVHAARRREVVIGRVES